MGTIQSAEISEIEDVDKNSYETVYIEVSLQTRTESLWIKDDNDYMYLLIRNETSLDDLARDLKNTSKNFRIAQEHRDKYVLINSQFDQIPEHNLIFNDSQIDNESWSGNMDSFDDQSTKNNDQKATPDTLLKSGYPEIKKTILEK